MRVSCFVVVFVVVVVFFVGACAGPSVAPARVRDVEHTPERLERGRYLGTHVAACLECHSTRDATRFGAPRLAGTDGKGGEIYTKAMGLPGTIVTPNITPAALSTWTDGELDRALTSGVAKDGHALFPLMPYPSYAQLCQDDVDALVAWLRTLAPVENKTAATELSFPMSLIVNSIPKDTARPPCPSAGEGADDVVARGKYLATAASCIECHSTSKRGQLIEGQEFAGGRSFVVDGGTVTSANITPGGVVGGYDADVFVAVFRAHADAAVVEGGAMQSNMPWSAYAGMTDADLKAIHAYLKSLPSRPTPEGSAPRWAPATSKP